MPIETNLKRFLGATRNKRDIPHYTDDVSEPYEPDNWKSVVVLHSEQLKEVTGKGIPITKDRFVLP